MRAAESLRSFKVAAWLGWQIESNWTDPFLFAVYSIVKPLASAGILGRGLGRPEGDQGEQHCQ